MKLIKKYGGTFAGTVPVGSRKVGKGGEKMNILRAKMNAEYAKAAEEIEHNRQMLSEGMINEFKFKDVFKKIYTKAKEKLVGLFKFLIERLFKENCSSYFPAGLPKWDSKAILAPLLDN